MAVRRRRAPRDGYRCGIKRQWARNEWATFRQERLISLPMSAARVMVIGDVQGDEIKIALASGIRQSNLHVVNWNPAIVATIRRQYPFVTTHGVDINRVLSERCPRLGALDFINLDLCGPIESSARTLGTAVHSLSIGGCIALTWAKGRDRRWCELAREREARTGRSLHRWDFATSIVRRSAALRLMSAVPLRHEQYRTAHTPMEWAMWKLVAEAPAGAPSADALAKCDLDAVRWWAAQWVDYHVLVDSYRTKAHAVGATPKRLQLYIPRIPFLPNNLSRSLLANVCEGRTTSNTHPSIVAKVL
jgi:hypothetical protein